MCKFTIKKLDDQIDTCNGKIDTVNDKIDEIEEQHLNNDVDIQILKGVFNISVVTTWYNVYSFKGKIRSKGGATAERAE